MEQFLTQGAGRLVAAVVIMVGCGLGAPEAVWAAGLRVGQAAPPVDLPSFESGRRLTLSHESTGSEGRFTILYFLDLGSKTCREGLVALDRAVRKNGERFRVVVVARQGTPALGEFVAARSSKMDIAVDDSGETFAAFDARFVLPRTIVLSPSLVVVSEIKGGGDTVAAVLLAEAERLMVEGKTSESRKVLAEAAGERGASDTRKEQVRAAEGFLAVREGRHDDAERTFNQVRDEQLKLEGLASVAYRKGDTGAVEKRLGELERRFPDSSYAHTLRGNVHFRKGEVTKSLAEYEKATSLAASTPWQVAEAQNNIGHAYAKLDRPETAVSHYDQSLSIYPDYVVPLSNKGVAQNRLGEFEEAEESLSRAGTLSPDDHIVGALLAKNREDIAFSKDGERQIIVNRLVADLVKRYRAKERKKSLSGEEEEAWIPRPTTVSILPFEIKGADPERDGEAEVLAQSMSKTLSGISRIRLVERQVVDKVLSELNIGSSEVARKDTQLELGQLLAARLLATGSVVYVPGRGFHVYSRFINSESSEILLSHEGIVGGIDGIPGLSQGQAQDITRLVREQFPFKGKVVSVSGDEVITNIGTAVGAERGVRLVAFTEGKPVVFEGEVLGTRKEQQAVLEITRAEQKMSFARILDKPGILREGLKLLELQ